MFLDSRLKKKIKDTMHALYIDAGEPIRPTDVFVDILIGDKTREDIPDEYRFFVELLKTPHPVLEITSMREREEKPSLILFCKFVMIQHIFEELEKQKDTMSQRHLFKFIMELSCIKKSLPTPIFHRAPAPFQGKMIATVCAFLGWKLIQYIMSNRGIEIIDRENNYIEIALASCLFALVITSLSVICIRGYYDDPLAFGQASLFNVAGEKGDRDYPDWAKEKQELLLPLYGLTPEDQTFHMERINKMIVRGTIQLAERVAALDRR